MACNTDTNDEGQKQRLSRISKQEMYMNVAFWMEMSPLAECPDDFEGVTHTELPLNEPRDDIISETEIGGNVVKQNTQESPPEKSPKPVEQKKSGAVFVLPNDRALSVDCSKAGVHAAVCALNKFGQEKVKGCEVYLSRRPCSFCAVLLVQCEVSKVYYLPFEPEWNDLGDVHRVDNIFKASSTALSIFTTEVKENVMAELKEKPSPFAKGGKVNITDDLRRLMEEYWSDEWKQHAREVLRWPAFQDDMIKDTDEDMTNLFEWIARATYADVPDGFRFEQIDPDTKKAKKQNKPSGEQLANGENYSNTQHIPTPSDDNWQKHAWHMCRMAQMLSQRSDVTEVTDRNGCILMLHNEAVSIGWNGFPAKALYGEFPRTSKSSRKKESYIIYAEMNALLTRNKMDLKDDSSTLFSNKIPAEKCIPMLIQAGVKNIVVPQEPSEKPENRAFFKALESEKLIGFWPIEDPQKNEASSAKRVLFDQGNR